MIEEKEVHTYKTNWTRNIILSMIKKEIDKFEIKELPVIKNREKRTNTFTYIFTIEKESYEFID